METYAAYVKCRQSFRGNAKGLAHHGDALTHSIKLALNLPVGQEARNKAFECCDSLWKLAFEHHIRFLGAREFLATGSANGSRATYEVSSANLSRFSREYKQILGTAPVSDVRR